MPRWTFNPTDLARNRALGQQPAPERRQRRRRVLNDIDKNDYELVRDGQFVLNDSVLLQASGSRESGQFERQTVHVLSEGGFVPVNVVTFDAGLTSRQVVRTAEVTTNVVDALAQIEAAQTTSELGQSLATQPSNDQVADTYVADPVDTQFPQLGGVASDPTTGSTTNTGGSVNTTPVGNVPSGGSNSGSTGGSVLPLPPPPPPQPPDTYDPNAYGNFGGGINDPGSEGL